MRRGLSETSPAIAIILARAGSKGLAGKNMLSIAGKPCAQWTIEHALASERVGAVVVSTDDPALLTLAQSMGALPIPRPSDLASDRATIDDAARHALTSLDALHARDARWSSSLAPSTPIVILYANVPVRPADLTDRAIALALSTNCDSVQSFARVGKHHPWWTVRVDESTGTLAPWEGDTLYHNVFRRQDLPPAFVPDGGTLVVTRQSLMHQLNRGATPLPTGPHAFLGRDRRAVVTPEGAVVDIDTRVDMLVADAILREAGIPARTRGEA